MLSKNPHAAGARPGLFGRLRDKLAASRHTLAQGLGNLLLGGRKLDDRLLEELETLLLSADVGVETTQALIRDLGQRLSRHELADARAVCEVLRQDLRAIVQPSEQPLTIDSARKPFVIMVVGVNGTGKTTSVAKLANRLKQEGHRVMLAAADTFRAAAVEQLKTWGERANVPVIAQQTGADAAAVAFDALQAARARGADVLIVDTAGRQHTHAGLMDELKKIKRVLGKLDDAAPHEVLQVLDAGTGQNALSQLAHFHEAVGVTGLVITKLDGTAKGGILVAIAKKTGLPIRFVGVGEAMDDLEEFRATEFVDALLPERQ
ncbi:MAG: signal recognition particle-docking protein FtsY [Pseudomonadota bacterium]